MPFLSDAIKTNKTPEVAKPQTTTPAAKTTVQTKKPSVQTSAVKPTAHSQEIIESVIRMQGIIAKLVEDMSARKNEIAKQLNITPDKVIQYANSFSRTGGKGVGQNDGVWGNKTKTVLTNINSFINEFKLGTDNLWVGNSENPSLDIDKEVLTREADTNADIIINLLTAIGSKVPEQIEGKDKFVGDEYDRVPSTLSVKQYTTNPLSKENQGSIPVLPQNIAHLGEFFLFAQNFSTDWILSCPALSSSKKEKTTTTTKETITAAFGEDRFNKLAKEILENSIYKLAQTAPDAPEEVVEGPAPKEGICFAIFNGIILWFLHRSEKVYAQTYEELKNRTKGFSSKNLENADKYKKEMQMVYQQWVKLKPYIEETLIEHNLEKTPVITLEIINEAVQGVVPSSDGRVRKIPIGYDGKGDDTGITQKRMTKKQERQLQGPIQPYMDLNILVEDYRDYIDQGLVTKLADMSALNPDNTQTLPILTQQMWRDPNSWKDIAETFINDKYTNVEKLRAFTEYANAIKAILNSAFRAWVKTYGRTQAQDNIENQMNNLHVWMGYIDDQIQTKERILPRILERLNKQPGY